MLLLTQENELNKINEDESISDLDCWLEENRAQYEQKNSRNYYNRKKHWFSKNLKCMLTNEYYKKEIVCGCHKSTW